MKNYPLQVTPYQPRPIRPLGLFKHDDWTVKSYSISAKQKVVDQSHVNFAITNLSTWLKNSKNYPLPTYKVATLIVHEGREGIFTLVNWWIDENMLQNHVYFSSYDAPQKFIDYSKKGITACVWELAVIIHERAAWIDHVLKRASNPDVKGYLNSWLNDDV